jgi:hypothetical protein
LLADIARRGAGLAPVAEPRPAARFDQADEGEALDPAMEVDEVVLTGPTMPATDSFALPARRPAETDVRRERVSAPDRPAETVTVPRSSRDQATVPADQLLSPPAREPSVVGIEPAAAAAVIQRSIDPAVPPPPVPVQGGIAPPVAQEPAPIRQGQQPLEATVVPATTEEASPVSTVLPFADAAPAPDQARAEAPVIVDTTQEVPVVATSAPTPTGVEGRPVASRVRIARPGPITGRQPPTTGGPGGIRRAVPTPSPRPAARIGEPPGQARPAEHPRPSWATPPGGHPGGWTDLLPAIRPVHVRIGTLEIRAAAPPPPPASPAPAAVTAPPEPWAAESGFDSFGSLRSYAPWRP